MDEIMIATGKSNCGDARKYIEYILGCIKAKPLFSTLVLAEKMYWEHLVWMDSANFGGVQERDRTIHLFTQYRTSIAASWCASAALFMECLSSPCTPSRYSLAAFCFLTFEESVRASQPVSGSVPARS